MSLPTSRPVPAQSVSRMIPIPAEPMSEWPEDKNPDRTGKTIRWTVDLDPDQHHALALLKIASGKTLSTLTRELWRRAIEEHNGTRPTPEKAYQQGLADGLEQARSRGVL